MSLPWKPASAAALATIKQPATIWIAQPAFYDAVTAWPCIAGMYQFTGGKIAHEETGEPPEGDAWLWVTEDEVLRDAFPTTADIFVDDLGGWVPPDLYARATAFAGSEPPPAVTIGDKLSFLARFVHAGGAVQLVELEGVGIEHGLVLAPFIAKSRTQGAASVQPAPMLGMVIYEPITGSAIAGGHTAEGARLRLADLIETRGGIEGFLDFLRYVKDSQGPANVARQLAAVTGDAA